MSKHKVVIGKYHKCTTTLKVVPFFRTCDECGKEIEPVFCQVCDGTGNVSAKASCKCCNGTGVVEWEEVE